MIDLRFASSGRLVLMLMLILAGGCESEKAPPGAASAPAAGGAPAAAATRPAPDTVLIRIGDAVVITQADFDRAVLRYFPPEEFDLYRMGIARMLVTKNLYRLYIQEHPELVDAAKVNEEIQQAMTQAGCQTPEQFDEKLRARGSDLEEFRGEKIVEQARAKVAGRGIALARNTAALRTIFDESPSEFDGTRVVARHIMLATAPYETPAEIQAKRDRLRQMRQDILSGKRSWEECVQESDCTTKLKGGNLGGFERHLRMRYGEEVAAGAFALQVGELSDAVEGEVGLHLIQVTARGPAWRHHNFEKEVLKYMRPWMEVKAELDALAEVRARHPVVGVRAPAPPPPRPTPPPRTSESKPGTAPAGEDKPGRFPRAIRPPTATGPATRPGTRPGVTQRASPTVRPGMGPATRPGITTRASPTVRPPLRPATRPVVRPLTRPATPASPYPGFQLPARPAAPSPGAGQRSPATPTTRPE